jgi:glycosyltransferase involved in cell wall biosynthesis
LTYSILITTKNRLEALKYTLSKCDFLLNRKDTEFIICDDGSTDGTFDYIKSNFPSIQLIENKISKGLIYSRNRLLEITKAKYAISLDDDAHFISDNPIEAIGDYFENNPKCGVQAFRIYWGKEKPKNTATFLKSQRVRGFVGCGHAWRMSAWRLIPDYPDWFIFYGEEEFASLQLFKNNWEVHYNPEVLVQHRVVVKDRKVDNDYVVRLRRSLRAGWFNYILFYPAILIPRKLTYSIWIQLKMKVFKGDFRALLAITIAVLDVIINMPKLLINRKPLSNHEYLEYKTMTDTFIYWNNKDEKH